MRILQLMETSGVKFGTSGARGLAADMTAPVCYAYAKAFLQVIGAARDSRLALAMDLRPSSPGIAAACAAAARDAGVKVTFCGVIPTPALAYHAQELHMPAIMVTGSHIPFDRNGIKFYRESGEITKADEAGIAATEVDIPDGIELPPLPAADPAARQGYVDRYLRYFPAGALAGMTLGFYEHSSVARDLLRDILEGLGARVISLGRTDEFVPIDTEAVAQADVDRARAWAAEHRFDAILSTDGDADRPLLGDEAGNWFRGDLVGILCARELGAQAVATPVSSNTAVEKCGAFARVARTRIGSPYVIEAMEQMVAAGDHDVVGFEANGGFLLGTRLERDSRRLAPLPTRDAVLPILALLVRARRQGLPVSALAGELPPRFTASDRIQNFATEKSRMLIRELSGSTAALAAFLAPLGVAAAGLDQTDGLRVTLASGEILHLRPSGNAPELRCYAEAEDQGRANDLVRLGLERVASWRG